MRQRVGHLVLNGVVFGLCYPLTNLLAQHQRIQRNLASTLDAGVPFVSWMVIPYASSGIFFILLFFLVRTREQLRVASRRVLFATVTGTLVFAFVPARFSLTRPIPNDTVPAALFHWLELVDQPFNQFPSLHVAYCVIFWLGLGPLCHGVMRVTLSSWLLLVATSTVLTWQHHLVDVAGGLLLGGAAAWTVRSGATCRHTVTFYYSIAAGIVLLTGVAALHSWIAAYTAVSLLMVASAYQRRHADFLLKRTGRHPIRAWLLFWPYIAGYLLTWALVRWHERHYPPFVQQAPGLWTGRRLNAVEARTLPRDCHVIDLCGELPEAASLCIKNYQHFPLLDLQAPRPAQLRRVLTALTHLRRDGKTVYVHCAMGYSRSRLIARLYLRKDRP